MNEKLNIIPADNEDSELARKLQTVAGQVQVNQQFMAELEHKLLENSKPPRKNPFEGLRSLLPALGWATGLIVLGVVLSLSIRNLIPQPGRNGETAGNTCPVTQPNGNTPPNEQPSSYDYGNGMIWTALWPEGKVTMQSDNQNPDGSYSMKWLWWRNKNGQMDISGRRLDTAAEPMKVFYSGGYDDNGVYVVELTFPTTGCWEITAIAGDTSLTIVTEVVTDQPIPTPEVVPSPIPEQTTTQDNTDGYDFRGAKLILNTNLPAAPAQVNVYEMQPDQQVTLEEARTLANRFGIQGTENTTFDYVFNVNDFYFTDGKQSLQVYSNRRFTYIADISKTSLSAPNTPAQNAKANIRAFLQAHGYSSDVEIQATYFFDGYSVRLLADNIPIQYEAFTFPPMLVKLDEAGNVLWLDASLPEFNPTPVGNFGIITAQAALDKLLNDTEYGGRSEFFSSSGIHPQEWHRQHPDNQTVTLYGYVTSYPAVDASQPPLIVIDGVPVHGNTSGMENLRAASFIKATGMFQVHFGIRRFAVDTWEPGGEMDYIAGTLRQDGEQVIFTADDGSGQEFQLIDPPANLPIGSQSANSQLYLNGLLTDGKMDWYFIQYFENQTSRGGGGGGGGGSFYQLNLSGTPIPFPTAAPIQQHTSSTGAQYRVQEGDTLSSIAETYGVSVQELMQANNIADPGMIVIDQLLVIPGLQNLPDQPVKDLRGFLGVVIHKKADGSQSHEYYLSVRENGSFTSYQLEGADLNKAEAYNGLPILVTGTIHPGVTSRLTIDSYTIPFPDLRFEIIQGTQSSQQLGGQTVVTFTTEDGRTFVEFIGWENQLTNNFIGTQGNPMQHEALIIPDETFAGMPVIRTFQSSVLGGETPMQIQANQITVIDDANQPPVQGETTPPNLIIDSVELIYYASNPYYQVNDPNYKNRSPYLQPVWHFTGHYENGDNFEAMIQALEQEFLKPELAPGISPG